MRYIFIYFLAIGVFANTEFYLKNNAMVRGDLIRDNEENVLVDVGYNIIIIPKNAIVKTKKNNISKLTINNDNKNSFFHQNTELKKESIKNLVLKLGESVVVVNTPSGMGTGFVINDEGYLITNYHVIEKEKNIKITMFIKSGKSIETIVYKKIKIVSINPFLDLALLKINDNPKKKFKFLNLGNMDNNVGDTVFAIGNPLGLERSVTQGIISSSNRNYNGILYIQTTTPINPGNSGGPLFNLKGEVIGVTNMGYVFSDGLGFAIPVDYLKHFLKNREAFYYNKYNYNTGFKYLKPPRKSK